MEINLGLCHTEAEVQGRLQSVLPARSVEYSHLVAAGRGNVQVNEVAVFQGAVASDDSDVLSLVVGFLNHAEVVLRSHSVHYSTPVK